MSEAVIQLAHGGGGRLSRELIEELIVPRFGDGALRGLPDAATVAPAAGPILFTTDSYVVQPIEFPGGNIGHLAVHGTVNDLAVSGALPRWLSLSLIMEEGLPIAVLERVLDSVKIAAQDCGVAVVTGDTKVVPRGQCDGLYVNTSGIGEAIDGFSLSPGNIEEGDAALVSGPLADHGTAVMAARHGLDVHEGVASDTAPVHPLVLAIRQLAPFVRFMRDPTRGGLATITNEAVSDRALDLILVEDDIPVAAPARAVCEMLGLDPLHVASEGRVILFCAEETAGDILSAWLPLPQGRGACRIGTVRKRPPSPDGHPASGRVILQTTTGGRRLVDVPRGELLPRIC